jgi:hypothetical protein
MKTTSEFTETFIQIIEAAGGTIRSYSGRGMAGERCVGVTLADIEPAMFLLDVLDQAVQDLFVPGNEDGIYDQVRKMLRITRTDKMGHGTVLYWPLVKWPKDREEVED